MSILRRLGDWLTPARRKAIYGLAASLGVLVQTLGLTDAVTVAHWLDVTSQVLAIGGTILAFANTDTSTPDGMPRRGYWGGHREDGA